jgi:hypothetical protein
VQLSPDAAYGNTRTLEAWDSRRARRSWCWTTCDSTLPNRRRRSGSRQGVRSLHPSAGAERIEATVKILRFVIAGGYHGGDCVRACEAKAEAVRIVLATGRLVRLRLRPRGGDVIAVPFFHPYTLPTPNSSPPLRLFFLPLRRPPPSPCVFTLTLYLSTLNSVSSPSIYFLAGLNCIQSGS